MLSPPREHETVYFFMLEHSETVVDLFQMGPKKKFSLLKVISDILDEI